MSGLGIRSDWQPLTAAAVAALPATLGVYEIADAKGVTQRIGYAGGHSLFGVRSALSDALAELGEEAAQFRIELNMQYMSRWKELLMAHKAQHGALPLHNHPDDNFSLGRLGPASGRK